jgi:hypothetical protein
MSGDPTLMRTTEEFVARARKLVDDSGLKEPPIDPARLAALQGIARIIVSHSLEVSGQLIRSGDELVIGLNGRESVERRNFSCCHEIAHAFALRSQPSEFQTRMRATVCPGDLAEEHMCDRAAAEMLMPEKFFKPAGADFEPNIASLASLSKRFVSSLGATMVRLGQLRVWPVVFIVWKFRMRLGSFPKLRVVWSVRPAGSRCFIPRHASADPSSGIYATFSTGLPTCENDVLNLGSLRGNYLVENARFGECVVSIVHDPKFLRGSRHAG